jgi:hypothetical protein
MSVFWLSFYVLIWPIITVGVLAVLSVGVFKDVRQAHLSGESLV